MSISAGGAAFRLQFQVSPIILTGGSAAGIAGGALPIYNFLRGLLSGLENVPFVFQPMPGGTLIDQQIGMYPFANQETAANATIQQPLVVSMLMICPAGAGGGYLSKLISTQALQASFDQHNKSGGLYSVMTPSFIYTNCVMLQMTDVSSTQTKQVQNAFKLDFVKPLVTLAQAAQAQNNLMSKISGGLPASGDLSGPASAAGSPSYPVTTPAPGTGLGGIGAA